MSETLTEDPMLERLDRIERRLDRLVAVLDDALPTIGMATDAADEMVGRLQARGVDVDARVNAALELVERATEPAALQRLTDLVSRLESLEPLLDMVANADQTVAMAADAFDAWAGKQVARGVDLDARGQSVAALLEKLSDPKAVQALEHVVDNLPRLQPLVDLAATFEGTTGMLFDMFDAQVAELQAEGIDPEARFGQIASLLRRLTDPEFHAHLEALLDAAPNLMAATRTGEVFGRAIDEVSCAGETPRVGMWGLLSAMSRPEVQRATGFAVQVAKLVGERLPEHMANCEPLSLPDRTR